MFESAWSSGVAAFDWLVAKVKKHPKTAIGVYVASVLLALAV